MAEELAREQLPGTATNLALLSPRADSRAELPSSKHLDVLLQVHLLPGRQGRELSFLQQETEGQFQFCPHRGVQLGNCAAPST